jgi:hypothetical protein
MICIAFASCGRLRSMCVLEPLPFASGRSLMRFVESCTTRMASPAPLPASAGTSPVPFPLLAFAPTPCTSRQSHEESAKVEPSRERRRNQDVAHAHRKNDEKQRAPQREQSVGREHAADELPEPVTDCPAKAVDAHHNHHEDNRRQDNQEDARALGRIGCASPERTGREPHRLCAVSRSPGRTSRRGSAGRAGAPHGIAPLRRQVRHPSEAPDPTTHECSARWAPGSRPPRPSKPTAG